MSAPSHKTQFLNLDADSIESIFSFVGTVVTWARLRVVCQRLYTASSKWKLIEARCRLSNLQQVSCLLGLQSVICLQEFRNEWIQSLASLTSLRSLCLDHSNLLDDNGLQSLTCFSSLNTLKLNCCSRITDRGLRTLVQHTALERLQIAFCRITDVGFANLTPLAGNLRQLDLRGLRWSEYGGTFRLLSQWTSLLYLDISETNINDDGLKGVTMLTGLQRLRLWACRAISIASFHSLSQLTALQTLDLGCTQVNFGALCALSDLTNLRNLYLLGSSIDTCERARALFPMARVDRCQDCLHI